MKKHTGLILLGAAAAASVVLCVLSLIFWLGAQPEHADAKIVIYEAPAGVDAYPDMELRVDGNPVFLYNTPVNNSHEWVQSGDPPMNYTPMGYFDFDGTVTVTVTLPEGTESVIVRPVAFGIEPSIKGGKLSFTISEPGAYTVEFNGSVVGALHLFANPIEQDAPKEEDQDVLFIGPGLWDIGLYVIDSHTTVYISGGAVVRGAFISIHTEDVHIQGRGIVDGSGYDSWTKPGKIPMVPIDFRQVKNASAEGVILFNPNAWCFSGLSVENLKISGIKIISARQNGDGITLQSCRNVHVSDCFVRSWDDSLVVKNYEGSSDNIIFDHIQIWTDLAQSMEIGYETNKGKREDASITNVTFQNITVLHNFHKPVISIHNSDDATVSGIVYRNITVEDARMGQGDAGTNNQLIDFLIGNSGWSSTKGRGHITNITIDGLRVLDGVFPPSRIQGFDSDHQVTDVKIKNLEILGERITSLDMGKFQLRNASDINIE